ncbi:unnamed protein product [Lampetra planeri]
MRPLSPPGGAGRSPAPRLPPCNHSGGPHSHGGARLRLEPHLGRFFQRRASERLGHGSAHGNPERGCSESAQDKRVAFIRLD